MPEEKISQEYRLKNRWKRNHFIQEVQQNDSITKHKNFYLVLNYS